MLCHDEERIVPASAIASETPSLECSISHRRNVKRN